MFLKKHLDSFKIYIFLILISTSVIIKGVPEFPIINFITYLFTHILLIYIGIYHFKIILFFIYFVIGFIFDVFLLNEIGTHTVTFVVLIMILSFLRKFYILMSSKVIFLLITILLFFTIICEMFISYILFDFRFDVSNLIRIFICYFIIAFPIYYIFNKIDRIG